MGDITTNLYDMNKALVAKLPTLQQDDLLVLEDKINLLDDGLGRTYFMLLSNEKKDYTVFNLCKRKEDVLGKEVVEVLNSRGSIKAYDVKYDEENRVIAVELWVNDTFYALFPYDLGVIEC